MKARFYLWLILSFMFLLPGSGETQNVVVCDWEIIDFPLKDAKTISEMLRVEMLKKHAVIPREKMDRELDAAHIVIPPHLEKADIQRLAELFQAKYLVTGLITRMEDQFILNVRLLEMPSVDTLISVSKNISGALLEPTQTFIPEIAGKLVPYLPVIKRKQASSFTIKRIIGITSIIGGGIIGYLIWPREEKTDSEKSSLPRPPKFPH